MCEAGYITVDAAATAEFTVERSRFIADVAPVHDEAEAQAFLQGIKKKHYDARHHCVAWRLGADDASRREKAGDDGEPSGTAGMPMLEVLKRRAVTDVILVVTRYFGGIKLGTGGLTRAYSHAAVLGMDAAQPVRIAVLRRLLVTVPYPLLGAVENWVRQKELRTGEATYAADVTLLLLLDDATCSEVQCALTDLTAGVARFADGGMEKARIRI